MKPLHIQTPLLRSQPLKNSIQKDIYFKLEALQPSGSFKLRGIGQLCQSVSKNGATSLVASSGGNAGVAVAYCGMKLNLPTTIFIPSTSHQLYIDAIESYGAKVCIAGKTVGDAQLAATEFAKLNHAAYIHPYDHSEIWNGHSTIIDEVIADGVRPEAVVVSVGGGGLACGVLEGMYRHGWYDTPLIAVETIGADVFAQSLKANQPVTLSTITSRATSLGATYAAPKLLDWATKHPITSIVVSDDDAEDATRSFAKEQRLLVELASGASLSLLYKNHPVLHAFKSILIIVCGGINTSHFKVL